MVFQVKFGNLLTKVAHDSSGSVYLSVDNLDLDGLFQMFAINNAGFATGVRFNQLGNDIFVEHLGTDAKKLHSIRNNEIIEIIVS